MKQRLPESEIEKISAQRQDDVFLALLREVCPQFLMKARHLHMREEEVLVEVEEILAVAKNDSKDRATQYFEALYERIYYDFECCSPGVPENEIHVVVSLMVYLAAALLFFYDGEKSAVLMHRYADDICISAARYASFHKDMRDKLFAKLDPKADVLSQIVSKYINGEKDNGDTYPEITESHRRLFEEYYRAEREAGGKRTTKLPVPIDGILHAIYDIASNRVSSTSNLAITWEPSGYGTARNWAILYRVLKDYGYISSEGRPKYSLFVECVVRYCFADVKESFKDSVGKYKFDETPSLWGEEDDYTIYKWLKSGLNFLS